MSENFLVTKRDGKTEPLNLEKIHKVLKWAGKDLNVSVSEVELKSKIKFCDGIKTSDIHKTLTKSAADLISEHQPDYQYMSAKLLLLEIRKMAYKKFLPPDLYSHIASMTKRGLYDKHILEDYSKDEINELNRVIDHDRDYSIAYAGMKQFEGKYLVQDRTKKGQVFESPQMVFMLVGMCLFSKSYKGEERMNYVKEFYDMASTFKISLPTPIMGGVRTPTRQFSSCVLIDSGDSLDSIGASSSAIIRYVSQRAGIGLNVGRIRALGSSIRGGEATHTGLLPFLKLFQSSVKSCSQGGVRGGAATVYFQFWHREFENLIVLKNNKGTDENRIRHLDYAVQLNKLFYDRVLSGGKISLFSPSDVPGLYDAFFQDQDLFKRLYEDAEVNPQIKKVQINALDAITQILTERANTGRIYIMHVDHANDHSPFDKKVATIYQSNLCAEISLPTVPLKSLEDEAAEVALCTLSAFNLGLAEKPSDLERPCEIMVRALDCLLDYQNYPLPSAKNSSLNRRTLGVGVVNYAYFLAKRQLKYSSPEAVNETHRYFEALQYYLMKASVKLSKEFGPCPKFNETTYSQGIMPIDTYKKNVDKFCSQSLELDWEGLRDEVVTFGMRNSTLSALMPSETSSQVSNSTNGIEPPRGLVSVKSSKEGAMRQVVPDVLNHWMDYDLLWDWESNDGYLKLVATMQKFIDQTISANTNYDPAKFPSGKVPMQTLIQDLIKCYSYGIKTLYYHNTRDQADEDDGGCAGGACKI